VRRDVVSKQGITKLAILILLILAADWPLVCLEDEGPAPHRTGSNVLRPVGVRQKYIS
jgi:hypothetical protein